MACCQPGDNLNSVKGAHIEDYYKGYWGVTRSLDYSSAGSGNRASVQDVLLGRNLGLRALRQDVPPSSTAATAEMAEELCDLFAA